MEPLIVDNTALDGYRRCFRYGYHRFEEGLTTERTPAALNFGIGVHAGLAAFAKTGQREESLAIALRSMKLQEVPADGKEEWRGPKALVEVLETIFSQEPVVYLKGFNEEPVVEADFLYPLLTEKEKNSEPIASILTAAGHNDILYSGIIDGVVVLFDQLYICDHKTTTFVKGEKGQPAYIDNNFQKSFKPHSATMGYCWGGSKFVSKPIVGVLIDAIGIHKKRILSPNFTSKDYLCFQRFTVSYSAEEIEEWRQGVIQLVLSILLAKTRGVYPQDPSSCFKYFNWCPFMDLCTSSGTARENVKGQRFIVDKWNPMDARKKEAARLGGEL